MSLAAGTKLGPYEIQSAIGAGGMGEVYRARDPRLGRDVAVKVLPAAFSADPERLQRFEQEARAAAALNHPNILAVYDIGQHPSTGSGQASPYIVSELLDGETLREPLNSGALPVRKHYMAPEQVEGKDADARSDIFSFGAILHEMVTGKRAFEGKSAASVIAAILEREPPSVSTLQPTSPPSLDRLLKRCLAKNPDDRWDTAHDLTGELRWVLEEPARIQTMHSGPGMWQRLGSFAAVAIALVGGGLAGWALKPSPAASPLPVTRFTVALPSTQRLTPASRWGLALSPDGATLVYVANNQLYLRFMDRQDAQPLPGTENAKSPFFSPDGQWVGFVGGPNTNQLKRVAIKGGAPITICDLPGNVFGARWEPDDTILYGYFGGIWKVSAAGGTPERLIALDAQKNEWAADPELLAGGTAILFRTGVGSSVSEFALTGQIVAQSLSSGSRRVLIDRALRAMALPTGHLLYAQETSLLAVPFDAA